MRLLKEIRNYVGNYQVKSGVFHFYRHEFKQAVEFLNRALREEDDLNPEDREYARCYLTLALMGLAERLAAKDEVEPAIEELRRAAEISPGYPDIHCRLAQLLERCGRIDEAVDAYRAALTRHPEYLDAHVALSFCLLAAGRADEATRAFERSLAVRMEQIRRPCTRGAECLERGQAAEAAAYFHEAFRTMPQLAQEFLNKALENIRAEDYEKARIDLDRALELNPRFPDLHNFRGIALCELGRFDEAAEAFRRSIALRPGHLPPQLNLAFTYLRAERYDDAQHELQTILLEHPSEPVAAAKLAELRTGRPPERKRVAVRGDQP